VAESVRLFVEDLQILLSLVRAAAGTEEMSVELHVGDGGSELMGDGGDETASRPIEVFEAADIFVAGDKASEPSNGITDGSDRQEGVVEAAVFAVNRDLALPWLALVEGAKERLAVLLGGDAAEEEKDLAAEDFVPLIAGALGKGRIDVLDVKLRVEHGDGIAHILQDGLTLFLLGLDLGGTGSNFLLQTFDEASVLDRVRGNGWARHP
jgi:hypothetical protein